MSAYIRHDFDYGIYNYMIFVIDDYEQLLFYGGGRISDLELSPTERVQTLVICTQTH